MRHIFPVLLLVTTSLVAAEPKVQIKDGKIAISNIANVATVRVVVAEGDEKDIADRVAIVGEWIANGGDGFSFTPKYPLKPETRYRVYLTADKYVELKSVAVASRRTAVKVIYPSATELPENILRFYVIFDKPMARGDAYKYINILTEKGSKVDQPFLELDEELWNEDHTRLTLLIDPGRIKREVKPRLDLGPVFESGKKYTLVISGKWPDLDDKPLGNDYRKSITVIDANMNGVDLKKWTITNPKSARDELKITFPIAMDRALLSRSIKFATKDGKQIAGRLEIAEGEKSITFKPDRDWPRDECSISVSNVLEDVSGNAIGRAFEIDVFNRVDKEIKATWIDLPIKFERLSER